MPNNYDILATNAYVMKCSAYKVGELVSIQQWQERGSTNNFFDFSSSHILIYWAPRFHAVADLLDGEQYRIDEIQPISPKRSCSLYDQFNMITSDKENFLDCLQKQLLHDYAEQCRKANEIQPEGAWVFCDISTCCYVLLSQEGVLGSRLAEETDSLPREQSPKSLADIDTLRKTLASNESILQYNKHHREYLDLIKKAIDLETSIPERQDEGIAFAWFLMNTERSETALRYLKSSGQINNFEEYDVKTVRDTRFLLLKRFSNRFMEQATDPTYKNLIWSILNFTMFLLELALYHEHDTEKFNDFMGMYPLINEDDASSVTLNTVSPIQYSPQFAYTFLCIPLNLRHRISGYLRQLLHEFFHYIPTQTRSDRNKLILKMFGHSVLRGTATEEVVKELVDFLYYHYKRLGQETMLFKDSMSFISIMRVVLNRVDIAQYLKKQGFNLNYQDFPNKSEQIEHLSSYTFFVREIRSDISMAKLLNAVNGKDDLMDLTEYIRLMANETDWASLSAEEASIDSILRFGFMTHWLLKDTETPEKKDIIIQEEIKKQAETYPALEQEYGNLIDYLKEYKKEKKIIASCDSELKEMASQWAEQDEFLNLIIGNDQAGNRSFWKDFISLYEKSDFDRCTYTLEIAQKDFGIMLLLLNLPYYKKYYIDYSFNE